MTVTVTAIVLSFNRPRMLREALATVAANRPDELILVDDGSAFDPLPLAAWDHAVLAEPLTVAERLVTPRLGGLINAAVTLARGDAVAYLCDDDLWAAGWLDAVRAHFAAHPDAAMVRGDWRVFSDGEPATDACPPCPLDARQMTTGNFAHRRDLAARWPTATVSSHDDLFLGACRRAGVDTFALPSIGVAGWRREHAHNALNFTTGHTYTAEAATMLAGLLEAER